MHNCLIVVNTYSEESENLAKLIVDFLKEKKFSSKIVSYDGNSDNVCFDKDDFEGFDMAVSLGGDGTVLFAARKCAKNKIPIFPVNLGQFGFIASVQKNEWKERLEDFLAGKLTVVKRSMVNATLIRNGEKISLDCGLNDVVISVQNATRTISLDVSYDNSPLGTIKADGMIVATATGSTSYSASAGGPIIDSELDALVLTLINPFSLSTRPIVLSGKGEISVKILPSRVSKIILTVDGQRPWDLVTGDIVLIKKDVDEAFLVGCTRDKFYDALRSKLNWMGGPRA